MGENELDAITHHVVIASIVGGDAEEVGGVGREHPKVLHGRDEVATKVGARVRTIDGLKGDYLGVKRPLPRHRVGLDPVCRYSHE